MVGSPARERKGSSSHAPAGCPDHTHLQAPAVLYEARRCLLAVEWETAHLAPPPSPCILAVDGCFELRVVTGPHRLADGYVLTEIGNQFCLRFGRTGSIALASTAANAGACAAS